MKEKNLNNITVIGADHQNTLGIIRACGMAGFCVNLIIHTPNKNETIRCKKSKYLRGTLDVVSESETELLELLLSKKSTQKVPIIPTSDFAALCIDNHFNELSQWYFLPSIAGVQGNITRHMDKYYQYKMLTQAGFKMAKTEKINLSDIDLIDWPSIFKHPVVLKPIVSAYGQKSDIVVSKSIAETYHHMELLRKKGYDEILIQEFINKDYELVTFGSITPKTKSLFYGTLKKIRYYPYDGGASLSYAEYVDADNYVLSIIDFLANIGYNGLFDIELFFVAGDIYINEINFRNSGNTWAIVKRGVNAPVAWISEMIQKNIQTPKPLKATGAFINETSDIHYVVDRKIGVIRWLRDLTKVKAFNKFWIRDIRGSLAWYKKKKQK